ncbi:MAG: DNA polymerase V [Rheinheimera sp.]|nr:DNA polymerase V [Rheinheimera sp.]
MEMSNISRVSDYKELDTTLDLALLKNSVFVGKASGHSMQGLGIFCGDILLIDRAVKCNHGDVIVVTYNGQFVCKIIDMKKNRLISASEDYQPIEITEFDTVQYEGAVTASIRMHRPSSHL